MAPTNETNRHSPDLATAAMSTPQPASESAPASTILTFAPPTAAYIHIPFCRRRCFYCDFPISVVGDRTRGDDSGTIRDYVSQLYREIALTPALGQPLQTIFFGGGTPSLLSAAQVQQVLTALAHQFGLAPNAEISMEMDPGTFDLAQAQGYVAAGVTRVSLGAQAFQADLLAACGRTHTPADIPVAVQVLREAGVTNVSLDLISGLPGLTVAHWLDSLERAIALDPTHLSVYDLTIEPGTVFGKRYTPGEAPLPSDEATSRMYRAAHDRLTAAGFEHYEISNYAKLGYQCRHNRVYWENRAYYGFGMAAASYVQGQRFSRPRTRAAYYTWLDEQAVVDVEPATFTDQLLDTLMLGLRLAEGLSLDTLTQQFGPAVVQRVLTVLEPYRRQGLVNWQDDRLWFTSPEGFLLSNTMLSALFSELDAGS
ncbi:radical SAM family heme chaperone HemW [Leptolyngbya sp. AN02str]|uniref:radical SAM family heme chaperone HemW n=1 Tax=Leptolyngbya sp. AN02str TaxID=3423363 RepID=UPI003D324200